MKKLWQIVTNKFLITGVVFAVWMIYFDSNSWAVQKQRKQEIKEIDGNITYLTSEIQRMENELKELTSNPRKIEQFAREKYKMKKDDEDLFIIEH